MDHEFCRDGPQVETADLVNGNLPVTLGGISVKIDNKDAFIQYVSPTQLNV